jgi:SepF-like predicted cell division protein (DUF552 family)
MASFFSKIKDKFSNKGYEDEEMTESENAYVELDTEQGGQQANKVMVRPFVLDDFSDIKPILDVMREGNTIALVNIAPLKQKDIVELKRAINKLKKTCDAIEGDIAGFSEDHLVIVPNFAEIYRTKVTEEIKDE